MARVVADVDECLAALLRQDPHKETRKNLAMGHYMRCNLNSLHEVIEGITQGSVIRVIRGRLGCSYRV